MPLYLFKCNEHGNQEVMQSMEEPHTANCPACGKAMQRIYSATNIKIKGKPYQPKTRGELFKHLESGGVAPKDFSYHDKHSM